MLCKEKYQILINICNIFQIWIFKDRHTPLNDNLIRTWKIDSPRLMTDRSQNFNFGQPICFTFKIFSPGQCVYCMVDCLIQCSFKSRGAHLNFFYELPDVNNVSLAFKYVKNSDSPHENEAYQYSVVQDSGEFLKIIWIATPCISNHVGIIDSLCVIVILDSHFLKAAKSF